MSNKIAMLNGSGKRKPCVQNGTTTTRQKENEVWLENITISEEIKSQLKFEVAVSLSTEISCSEVKATKTQRTKSNGKEHENRKVFSPITQFSPTVRRPLKADNQTSLSKLAIGNRRSPAIKEGKPDFSKTPVPTVLQDFETQVTPKHKDFKDKVSVSLKTTPVIPQSFKAKPRSAGEKRKIEDNSLVGSPQPKKRSGGDLVSKSTPKTLNAKPHSSTPTNGRIRTPTRETTNRVTPKRTVTGNLKSQDGKKNVPKHSGSVSKILNKEKSDKTKTATPSPTMSPFATKRHRPIYQSPRPEGCISPKRKPGTPWRECQLRKLAEQQKAADEQNKVPIKKTNFESVLSAKNTLQSPLARPPLRENLVQKSKSITDTSTCEPVLSPKNTLQSPLARLPFRKNMVQDSKSSTDASTCEIESEPEGMTFNSKNEGTAVDGNKPAVVSSPSGSDVDSQCVQTHTETTDNEAQTTSPKTVMTRFKDKLTQSFSRTVEYFHEVKNIWDGKPDC